MTRPRILLDCDPGIDDAFAIMCALRFCELVAVTTVSGNVPLAATTANALYVLEQAAAEHVPVHQGADRPLVVPAAFADDVHGPSGLGAKPTPRATAQAADTDAIDAMLANADQIDALIATGPLTNVAHFVNAHPEAAAQIPVIHWMGGSTTVGNVTPEAEFNAWADPDAIDVVFRTGIPIVMYGLNLTHQVRMTQEHVEMLQASTSATAQLLGQYLSYYSDHGNDQGLGQPMHDPCAVLGFTHAALFSCHDANMVVHTADNDLRGKTVPIDSPDAASNTISIVDAVDAQQLLALIVEAAEVPRDSFS